MPEQTVEESNSRVSDARRSWELPATSKAILYAHRLSPNKGLDLAIEALTHLDKSYSLIVVGPDTGNPAFTTHCRELVTRWDLGKRVRFIGPVARHDVVFSVLAADIFVLPARRDTFPMAVLQALACRRPVVLTNTCQSVEALAGVPVVVDPTPQSIARGISSLEEMNLELLGHRGQRLITDRFSPTAVARSLEELYRRIGASSTRR
jgi:glycosyltransferase involved in cell wall biosynthesis